MAIQLNSATPDYLRLAAVPSGLTRPFTISCWFQATDLTNHHTLFDITASGSTNNYYILRAGGGVAGDPVILYAQAGALGGQNAQSTNPYTINTWHHACGIVVSQSRRIVYLDGGSKDDNVAGAVNPVGTNRTDIGYSGDSSPGFGLNGKIAEVAIHNVQLTDEEVAILAMGYSPLLVRPDSLILYLPLINTVYNELFRSQTFTAFGAPVAASHPRMYYVAPPPLQEGEQGNGNGGGEVPEAIYVGPHPNQHQKRLRVSLGSQ